MSLCINCGSDKVERQGDDFTCHKCQFHWDVALEQANRVYLRSQGRMPATSVLDPTTAPGREIARSGDGDGQVPAGEPEKLTADTSRPTSTAVATDVKAESTPKGKKG